MFRKLTDVPECLGNIDGVDYEADIPVRLSTNEEVKKAMKAIVGLEKELSADKIYHVYKITSYGDPFDVWITNDLGEKDNYCEWYFEDIDGEVK